MSKFSVLSTIVAVVLVLPKFGGLARGAYVLDGRTLPGVPERFVRVAERAMARRQQPLTPGMRALLLEAHALSAAEREAA